MLRNFLLGPLLQWLPSFFYLSVLAALAWLYFRQAGRPELKIKLQRILALVLIFKLFYLSALTFAQYYVWNSNKFTKILLHARLSSAVPLFGFYKIFEPFKQIPFGYFIYYVFSRFWQSQLILVFAALAFFFVIWLVARRDSKIDLPQMLMLLLSGLLVAWPDFLIFLVLGLVFSVIFLIYTNIFKHSARTAIVWPFLLAALIIILFGAKLVILFKLGVLKV